VPVSSAAVPNIAFVSKAAHNGGGGRLRRRIGGKQSLERPRYRLGCEQP
jgi:hypothetical protein